MSYPLVCLLGVQLIFHFLYNLQMYRNFYIILLNCMFDNNIISMERIPLKQESTQSIMLMIDRILNHFQQIAQNNMKTLQIYIDLCKEKYRVSSIKLKQIYALLSDNKAKQIFFQKERTQIQQFPYESHEAITRLCWRFIERGILKCSYFILNKKYLSFISEYLIKLIKLNKKLGKNVIKLNSVDILTTIINEFCKENQRLQYEIIRLLVDRGYICSIDQFHSINGLTRKDEDRLYERTIFQEQNQNDEYNGLDFQTKKNLQSYDSYLSTPNHTYREGYLNRGGGHLSTFFSKKKLKKINSMSVFPNIEKEEQQNAIKPINYSNWRKNRVGSKHQTKIISIQKMASTIDERFERLVTEIVKNDVFNTHLEDEEVSFQDYFQDNESLLDKNESFLETQDRKKISYFERSEAEGDMNKIMRNIKRSNTNSSTSKISSRLLDLMEKVKKENNKKQAKNYFIFMKKPRNKLRTSINLLMGEAILNKENYNIEMNFNSSSNVNSALTINSLKLYKDINKPNKNSEQKKKKDDNREDRNQDQNLAPILNKNDKIKEIEKEMINVLIQKNVQKSNSEMFRNIFIKERHSSTNNGRKNSMKKKTSSGSQKLLQKPVKSIFGKINQEGKKSNFDLKIKQMKVRTQVSEGVMQTFPEYCRHENIGKKQSILKKFRDKSKQNVKVKLKEKIDLKSIKNGPRFRIYDTRRRQIIV